MRERDFSIIMKYLLERLSALPLFLLPVVVFAQNPDTSGPQELVQGALQILNIIVTILFVVAIAVFGWGIIKLIASAGDPEKRKEAKGILIWGVIAIAVLALLFGLVQYLSTVFGVDEGTLQIDVPTVTPGGGGA